MSVLDVKFCGLASLDDAREVNSILQERKPTDDAGRYRVAPRYAGLVFWPKSKRLVTLDEASAIRRELDPSVTTVGVFVDASLHEVVEAYERGIIQIAQLHGSEDGEYIRKLREAAPGLGVWKAFEVKGLDDIAAANGSSADLVLLDGGKGEGNAFRHELLPNMRRRFGVAGGLSPDNIGDMIAQLTMLHGMGAKAEATAGAPTACLIDVSSGIEASADGSESGRPRKDPDAMRRFLDQAEHALCTDRERQRAAEDWVGCHPTADR